MTALYVIQQLATPSVCVFKSKQSYKLNYLK